MLRQNCGFPTTKPMEASQMKTNKILPNQNAKIDLDSADIYPQRQVLII
jgi:hypothetical protein